MEFEISLFHYLKFFTCSKTDSKAMRLLISQSVPLRIFSAKIFFFQKSGPKWFWSYSGNSKRTPWMICYFSDLYFSYKFCPCIKNSTLKLQRTNCLWLEMKGFSICLLPINRVDHETYLSVPFPSHSNLCLSHLIPSHRTFPMGFP